MAINDRVVQRWLQRGQKFFGTMTGNGTIRAALRARGLTRPVLLEGWRLYSNVLGFGGNDVEPQETIDVTAADAEAQLDAWDAPNYSAIAAVIEHRYPDVQRYLFNGVTASTGAEAVAGVERLLDHFQDLADGKAKEIDPKVASEAVSLLRVRRLLDEDNVIRLRGLIDKAQSGAASVPPADLRSEKEFEAAFLAYKNWIHEWREIARSTFTRRDHLIMLGLASRRKPKKTGTPGADDPDDGDDEGGDE